MEVKSENDGVTDDVIAKRLRELLETVDLATTTTRALRERLQDDLGVDMSDKKDFIKAGVQAFLDERNAAAEEENSDKEEEDADVKEEAGSEEGAEESSSEEEDAAGEKPKRSVFQQPCQLSPALAAFLGVETMARGQVVKEMWKYIKEHGLQCPTDRRRILCDERMQTVFPAEMNMLSMNKHLAKHVFYVPRDGSGAKEGRSRPPKRKAKEVEEEEEESEAEESEEEEEEEEEEAEEPKASKKRKSPPLKSKRDKEKDKPKKASAGGGASKGISSGKKRGAPPVSTSAHPRAAKKEKRPRVSRGGNDEDKPKRPSQFSKPQRCSPELVQFLDGQEEIPRPALVKHMWDYIKEHNLQNENDKSIVKCDDKLEALLNVSSFKGFGMMKYLKKHLTPLEG
eukprot:jgi/Mesvir1/499/Mv11367-RA.1